MKPIFLILTTMFPEEGSHRYPFVYDHVRAIQRTGRYEIAVLKAVKFSEQAGEINYRGIKVFRFHQVMNVSRLFSFINFFEIIKTLQRAGIAVEDIEICQIHGWGSLLGSALYLKKLKKNMRAIRHYDDFDPLIFLRSRYYKIPILSDLWKRRVVQQTAQLDLHVGVSSRTISCLEAMSGIDLKGKYVLYNGVDVQKFYKIEAVRSDDFFKIGCVGNFIPLKDQMTLIRATELLINSGMTDLRLRFVGSGPTLAICQEYVEGRSALRDRIEFLQEVDHRKLNEFYNSLDLFVLPSVSEAFGCVYAEAWACGVPFMACCGQGIEELVPEEDRDRWLIDPHDFESLAQKIKNFRKERFIQRLNQPIDIDWHVGRYLDFLEEMDGWR